MSDDLLTQVKSMMPACVDVYEVKLENGARYIRVSMTQKGEMVFAGIRVDEDSTDAARLAEFIRLWNDNAITDGFPPLVAPEVGA